MLSFNYRQNPKISRATSLINQGKSEEALIICIKLLPNPKCYGGLYTIARFLIEQNKFDQAAQILIGLMKHHPNEKKTYISYARMFETLGFYGHAEIMFERAIGHFENA